MECRLIIVSWKIFSEELIYYLIQIEILVGVRVHVYVSVADVEG